MKKIFKIILKFYIIIYTNNSEDVDSFNVQLFEKDCKLNILKKKILQKIKNVKKRKIKIMKKIKKKIIQKKEKY